MTRDVYVKYDFRAVLLAYLMCLTCRVTEVTPANGGVYRCTARTSTGSFDEDYVFALQGKLNKHLLIHKPLFPASNCV
jgi:hypothetical protein